MPFLFLPLLLWVAGCGHSAIEKPIGTTVVITAPLGLPALTFSKDNPPTAETIALGRKLFYDPVLSGDNTIACASCHNPRLGFSDGQKHSTGVGGKTGMRNAPTVLNAAYARLQFWDGRAANLEDQSAGPIANPLEMNQTHGVCTTMLDSDPVYKTLFAKAFGPGPVTMNKLQKAIASFERTIVSGNSSFDRYRFGGDQTALNAAAIHGLEIFADPQRGNCATCHSIERTFALFSDGKFHNLGVGVNAEGEMTDLGRYDVTKDEHDKGAFKTPILRNIAQTGPYMHDGSLKTLKDVVDFYAGGGNSNPHLDREIKSLALSGTDRADLVEFLKSLTGDPPQNADAPKSK